MNSNRIVFVCHFSNSRIRRNLKLKEWRLRNLFYKITAHPLRKHKDCDVWVSDFIEEFEKDKNHEYHIVATHRGLKKQIQKFSLNGINYTFLKSDGNLLEDIIEAKYKLKQKNNYNYERRKLKKIIDDIDPALVVVCGAEMPEYSSICLDIVERPVFLLLQTVLNNPELSSMSDEGNGYRARLEYAIFQKVKYYGSSVKKYKDLYNEINPNSVCLKTSFPSHCPKKVDVDKKYDFGYYGRATKNKGIIDLIKAFAIVLKQFPAATLNIVSELENSEAGDMIRQIIRDNNMEKNVVITRPFEEMEELFLQVQKSRCMVLPGITAPINCTVRESMLMGLPVIMYQTTASIRINQSGLNVIEAKMEDVDDLSNKMKSVLSNSDLLGDIKKNGEEYAKLNFNNSEIVNELVNNFDAIINCYYKGEPIPSSCLFN